MISHGEPGQERIVTMSHVFQASPELVWEAWTDAKHLAQWWCPEYFTIPACQVDAQPGGTISLSMQGPDGVLYPMVGTYKEVVKPEKLVFVTSPLDAEDKPLFEILNTALFTKEGETTRLTLVLRVLSSTVPGEHFLAGMEEGWKQSLAKQDRLFIQSV